LVGFYIKFVKAKAIFTVPWSATIFFIYYFIFVFPAGEAKLFMAKLHRGNAYDSTVLLLNCLFSEKKKG
jgi:uncharacterized membrane protein (DUF485 family)